jgi:hypothetical protein
MANEQVYQIKVQGKLDEKWSSWFEGLTVTSETLDEGATVTVFAGSVADQAALRGILEKIWDLNLTLISVFRVDTGTKEGAS